MGVSTIDALGVQRRAIAREFSIEVAGSLVAGAKRDFLRLVQWWTEEDVRRFRERTQRLVAQYDSYEPLPGLNIRGAQTLGENIADNAGLAVACDAYRISLGGREALVLDGFTGDQY